MVIHSVNFLCVDIRSNSTEETQLKMLMSDSHVTQETMKVQVQMNIIHVSM